MHIVYAKLGQADAGDNEAKLITKLAPEWVRTSDPVIRSPARYRWTTAPAQYSLRRSQIDLVCWSLTSLCHSNGHIVLDLTSDPHPNVGCTE